MSTAKLDLPRLVSARWLDFRRSAREATDMIHVVLLGDSIFDNATYVPGWPPVIEQLRERLGVESRATLLAVDGASSRDVREQLAKLPPDSTHHFVSVGGNDALDSSSVLGKRVATVAEAVEVLAHVARDFRRDYGRMTQGVLAAGKPTTICTVYDSIPGLDAMARSALALFNDVILRIAFRTGLPVIDLRLVCNEASDYSDVSPIEPSNKGGAKIAIMIEHVVATHDFALRNTTIYGTLPEASATFP